MVRLGLLEIRLVSVSVYDVTSNGMKLDEGF